MDFKHFWKQIHRLTGSEGARRFRLQARQVISLHWWISRSWKFKVQFLIGLAALLLLVISLTACVLYEYEHSKLTKNFMRLQIFGPQKIYCPSFSSSAVSDTLEETKGERTANFCPFHVETRYPYGNALPGVRIEAEYQTLDGTPFWFHSDKTGKSGTFQLPFPNMPMPELVKLVIHAEDGQKQVKFTSCVKVCPDSQAILRREPSFLSESIYAAKLADVTLDTLETCQDFFPAPYAFQSVPVSVTLSSHDRLAADHRVNVQVTSLEKDFHPVFLGIWDGDSLLACRPIIAGKKSRVITLPIPKSISGMVSLLLIDYSVSPPKVLQHELLYVPGETDETKTARQELFLEKISEIMDTPQYRAEKQQLDFLPQNLENPRIPETIHPERIADKSSPEVPAERTLESEENQHDIHSRKKARLLNAADHLLASALIPESSFKDRFHLEELQFLRDVCANLDHIHFSLQCEKKTVTGKQNEAETGKSELQIKSISRLISKALKLQSQVLNRNLNQPETAQRYEENLPLVFDSLSELERERSEAAQFKARTRVLMSRLSCLILSSATCLVWMMLMMSILGLPTDWRIWILTLGVVLFALSLSCLISSQSNMSRERESIRYETWSLAPQTILPETRQEREF